MEEKIKALMEQEGFVEKMLACEEPEDVQKLFGDNGVELSLEDVKAIGKALDRMDAQSGELAEEDLQEVAGGVAISSVIIGTIATIVGTAGAAVGFGVTGGAIGGAVLLARKYFRRW